MRPITWVTDMVRLGQGQFVPPRFLTYTVTFTCNARCIMCDSWKKPGDNDLKLQEVESIFRQLPRLDAVRLTGGEPFVRPDLPEIAELARQHLRPMFLHVTTNGFLTDRVVTFCENRNRVLPLRLLLSLDGTEEKHNQVRGRETAWKSTTTTLKALAPRQSELNLKLSVNQVILGKEGIEEYRRLRDFLRPYGVRHQAIVAYHASATYSLKEEEMIPQKDGIYETFGELSEEDVRSLTDEMEADTEAFPWAEKLARRYYIDGLRNRMLRQKSKPNPRCVALKAHLRLLPNGDVPVCQFNTHKVGNLRTSTFEEIWYGDEIKPHREWVGKCPGCWAECEVVPNALYTGDLFRHAFSKNGNF